MGEAANEDFLGFKYVELFESKLKVNARMVEDALQRRYHTQLPLGVRLWRGPDRGSKFDRVTDTPKAHKVFVSLSPWVPSMLADQDQIMVNQ